MQSYVPVLVCAILVFLILACNPKWLKGKQYGDKPKDCPDALMTSLVVLVVGALTVWLMGRNGNSYEMM